MAAVPENQLITISELHGPDVPRVSVAGEVDMSTVTKLTEAVWRHLDRGLPALVLDMSEVTFFESTGISALMQITDKAAESGTKLAIVASRPVRRPLELVGLTDRFMVVHSVEEALTALV